MNKPQYETNVGQIKNMPTMVEIMPQMQTLTCLVQL